MATISYDEKPGIQALAVTTPDRPPVVGQYASHLRDCEYQRLGTVSLLAGLDLHSGRVIEIVSDTHKSADFIAFLKKLDATYAQTQKIGLVLDNPSAHISKETRGYLDTVLLNRQIFAGRNDFLCRFVFKLIQLVDARSGRGKHS